MGRTGIEPARQKNSLTLLFYCMKCECTTCKSKFDRIASEIARNKSGRLFCSRTCAAKFNNKVFVKRSPKKKCACGAKIRRTTNQCQKCHLKDYLLDNKTLNEATSHRKGSSKYINIRKAARTKYMKCGLPKMCAVCNYDKHFEVCHIKSICDFAEDAMISDINALSNLVALCPNHHWELDHGFIIGLCGN